jgi:hypothetical protein
MLSNAEQFVSVLPGMKLAVGGKENLKFEYE